MGLVTIAAFVAYLRAGDNERPAIQGFYLLYMALEAGLSITGIVNWLTAVWNLVL